jgi:hypothetical protein
MTAPEIAGAESPFGFLSGEEINRTLHPPGEANGLHRKKTNRRIESSGDHELDDAEEIVARLRAMSGLEYERQRHPVAKKLRMRVSALDELVKGGDGNRDSRGQGRPPCFDEPEPWPQPVTGTALLDELAAAIRRHVVLDQVAADAVALWVVGTYAFDAWRIFPRLFVTAAEKRCGKTTLLDLLAQIVPKPLHVESASAPALFRVIERERPTLLLDEADHYRRDNEDLRAVINSGHACIGSFLRCVGEDFEPRQFSTWAPMALAAIGRLWSTVEDRSIIVTLHRKAAQERVESLRGAGQRFEILARKAARWAVDHIGGLAAAEPEMPAGIINRAADNWHPLFAVADAAGGDWPGRARNAAAVLSDASNESESTGEMLLADLRRLFNAEPSGVLFTREIRDALTADEKRPWGEWKSGKPLSDIQLAKLLKPYGIRPHPVRRGTETGKGYRRAQFDDAFSRYLPPEPVTPSQSSNSAGFAKVEAVTDPVDVTASDAENASVSASCDGVTVETPGRERWNVVL